MGAKIHNFGSGDWGFHCPGCGYGHSFRVGGDPSRPQWKWNGSLDKPTFTPSLLVNQFEPNARCHSIVTDGVIFFCSDSYHNLRGSNVELPDWEEEKKIMAFDFGTPSKTPAATKAVSPTKNPPCPKCGKELSTGGTTRYVCASCGLTLDPRA